MTEILNSMKLIKMYAWEDSFSKKVSEIRKEEMKRHRLGGLLQAVGSTMVPSISILASICTILGYTLTGLPLKSSEAFTIYSVLNAMQFTVGVLPFTIRSIAEAKISLARIQKLLGLPEHVKKGFGLMSNKLKARDFAWRCTPSTSKARARGGAAPPKKNKAQGEGGGR
ncbi:UNVERIFIED_CONTAM: hypothetical protein GTU68_014482, partial [Idotea baltica]|nr:hypothetical protein [Idotea baltica]